MVKARKYVVKRTVQGLPKRDDLEIVEYELPPLKNGEILVKVEWVSVNPAMWAYDQRGHQVGLVKKSMDPSYPVGCRVVSFNGWSSLLHYCIINPNVFYVSSKITAETYKLPNMNSYFGFLEYCKLKPGGTVLVTGAAGAVGSLVGQIAKIKDCKIIGFAGSDDKVKWLETIGFDKAINYKTDDIAAVLKKAAPEGVDCYFDNVGGELSSTIEQFRAKLCILEALKFREWIE